MTGNKKSKNLGELISIPVSLKFLFKLVRHLARGESLERSLMNISLENIEIFGRVIDLGSGKYEPSYIKHLKRDKLESIIYTDLYRSGKNIIKNDLERPFKKINQDYDFVLCFNTLEHIYNYKNVIKESYRILKKGGYFLGSTPFLYNFHPSPNDYYRFTHSALKKMFKEENYQLEKIVYLGFGPLTASYSTWFFSTHVFIRIFLSIICILIDEAIFKKSEYFANKYALGYLFTFRKK